jgi:prefoldin subunit 5
MPETPPEERVRELAAELAAARAEIRELQQQIARLGGEPVENAQVEGADVGPEAA